METGTGALIVFGAVQVTMILMSLLSGNRLPISEWIGAVIAFGGLAFGVGYMIWYAALPRLSSAHAAVFLTTLNKPNHHQISSILIHKAQEKF